MNRNIFFIFFLFGLSFCDWNQFNHDPKCSSRSEYQTQVKSSWDKGLFNNGLAELVSPIIDSKSRAVILPNTKAYQDFHLFSFDADTGEEISIPIDSMIQVFPKNLALSNEDVVFMGDGPSLLSYSLVTGKRTLRINCTHGLGSGEVAFANDGETVIFFHSGMAVWSEITAVDYTNKKEIWNLTPINQVSNNPFTIQQIDGDDDILYQMNYTTILKINTKTGKIEQSNDLPEVCGTSCQFSKISISEETQMIIIPSSHFTYGLDLESMKIIWRIGEPWATCNAAIISDSGNSFSQICLDRRGLYLNIRDVKTGNQTNVYSFGLDCNGYSGELRLLAGLKKTDTVDVRVVFACVGEYLGQKTLKFHLLEDDKIVDSKEFKNTFLGNFIADSSDCVYFTQQRDLMYPTLSKFCF